MATRRTIDVQDGDQQWVDDFVDDVRTVCGLIEECFVEHPATLLSPILRQLVVDRARQLEAKRIKILCKLCVDNLHGPLSEKAPEAQHGQHDKV